MGIADISQKPIMICSPLMGPTVEEMLSEMKQAKAQGADIAELWLGCINNFNPQRDLQILLRNKPLPLIVVYRSKWEAGACEGDQRSRSQVLLLAKQLGADYVEFDLKLANDVMRPRDSNPETRSKTIASYYCDGVTPKQEDLGDLVASLQSTGADIIKLVTNAANITELARIFHLHSHSQVPLIAYSIGDRGLISQLLCRKFGGFLVYGSMEGHSIAGLPTLSSLVEAYKVDYTNADTKVYGLISKPVSHSKGPILHNPTFRNVGHNGLYVPMFVDDLKEFFNVYSTPDFSGFSVGIPYKEAVIAFCDEVHPLAQLIGAVNTIVRRPADGKLIGYNTDCEASITAIEDALSACRYSENRRPLSSALAGKMFVLVGAGGAGRALAFGAKSRGAQLVIFDIDYERAKTLARAVSGKPLPFEDLVNFQPQKGAVLANATPLGMHPNTDRIPIAEVTFGDYELVFDSVYTPRKTRLLKEAEAAGAIIVSGVEMFLRQAIGQFNLFTGLQAPEEFMREIVLAKF